MAGLASITQTCTPRPDIGGGGLTDNHSAAQLDQIVRNPSGYPVYGDPDEFFAITYPTSGLHHDGECTGGLAAGKEMDGT